MEKADFLSASEPALMKGRSLTWEVEPQVPPRRAWYHYPLNAFLFHALRLTLRLFSREAISRVRIPFADLYFFFAQRDREALVSNIHHILGEEVPREEAVRLARNTFRRYAQYLIDLICAPRMKEEELRSLISRVSNEQAIEKALQAGTGAILLTAHLGNWELGGIILKALHLPVNIVYFPDRIWGVEKSRRRYRERRGVGQLSISESPFSLVSMIQALRRNEIVCLQGDRNYGRRGVKIDFFGSPVAFPPGPVILAMASKAPLIPLFILQEDGKGYRFLVEDPVPMQDTGNREEDIRQNLIRVVRILER
ncbi:MAG: lysophospholipid acyltransferase family protein, partial [candidate division NC10 bacterium]|nr:lysophospholipid acyltransferase family protein [candidate division NC10 bacterium]